MSLVNFLSFPENFKNVCLLVKVNCQRLIVKTRSLMNASFIVSTVDGFISSACGIKLNIEMIDEFKASVCMLIDFRREHMKRKTLLKLEIGHGGVAVLVRRLLRDIRSTPDSRDAKHSSLAYIPHVANR
jgi:hypothetical protein